MKQQLGVTPIVTVTIKFVLSVVLSGMVATQTALSHVMHDVWCGMSSNIFDIATRIHAFLIHTLGMPALAHVYFGTLAASCSDRCIL